MTPTPADLQDLRENLSRIYRPEYAHHVRRFNCLDTWLASAIAQVSATRLEFRLADITATFIEGDRTLQKHAAPGVRASHAAIARNAPARVSEFLAGQYSDNAMRNQIRRLSVWLGERGFARLAYALSAECMHVENGNVIYDPPVNAPSIHT
jgi:hypothetical protein